MTWGDVHGAMASRDGANTGAWVALSDQSWAGDSTKDLMGIP